MDLKVKQKDLESLANKVQGVVGRKSSMPVLLNVILSLKDSKLNGFATDLDISIKDSIDVEEIKAGSIGVNAKNLYDLVKELPLGELRLRKVKNNLLEISQNNKIYHIVGLSEDEFPKFPEFFKMGSFIKFLPDIFCDMVDKTIYSVSNDESRYHLNGVFFEILSQQSKTICRMVSTDGHRLSLIERAIDLVIKKDEFKKGIIIPKKALSEIRKLLENSPNCDFGISFDNNQMLAKIDNTSILIKLIEGRYPNYQDLIPKEFSTDIHINKEELLSSLKRVSLLSHHKSKSVTFDVVSSGVIKIKSQNPELGDAKEEINVEISNNKTKEDIQIAFNARYVLDILSCIKDDKVSIKLNNKISPGLLRSYKDSGYTCVVMPMNIH